jgi:hypothetical protein
VISKHVLLSLSLALAACGGDDGDSGPRPMTYGEACEQYSVVSCAFEDRSIRCGEQEPDPDRATCEQRTAATCCGVANTHPCADAAPASMPFMSFAKYDECVADIKDAACGPQPTPPSSCNDAYP